VNSWIAVKGQAVQAGAKEAILRSLIQGEIDAASFSDAVLSKLNVISKTIGQGFKSQFDNALDKAIREYRGR
jgi:ABC-type amino acid transport substrate-binding protein